MEICNLLLLYAIGSTADLENGNDEKENKKLYEFIEKHFGKNFLKVFSYLYKLGGKNGKTGSALFSNDPKKRMLNFIWKLKNSFRPIFSE